MRGGNYLPTKVRFRLRLVSAVIIWAVVFCAASPGAAGTGSDPTGGRTPVVLVHGLTCGGSRVWGERSGSGRGLYAALLGAGYVPGQTLFCYDYDNLPAADYEALARVGLAATVDRVLAGGAASGTPGAGGLGRFDMIAFGTGALVARCWAATDPAAGSLRNLVLIAPPNHGMFQADLLKVLYHTDRLVKQPGAGPGGGAAPDGGFPPRPLFAGENQYVAVRAGHYRLLYGEYVLHGRILGQAPDGAPPPTWEEWVVSERPELARDLVYDSQVEPDPPGGGLTLAYYEMLSLEVGRQLYLAGLVRKENRPESGAEPPSLDGLLDGDWATRLKDYLLRLVVDWGTRKARELWARHRSGIALTIGELLTGLEPGGAALSRLVPEYLAFPGGSAAPVAPPPGVGLVLCNAFLHRLGSREAGARGSDSRYVTVAASFPGLLTLLGLDVGPNDLVIEAASAVAEPRPADEFLLERGLLWAHGQLPGNARLFGDVLRVLDRPGARGPEGSPGGDAEAGLSGGGAVALWSPEYRALGLEPGPVVVRVAIGDPAASGLDGLRPLAWLAEDGGAREDLGRTGLEPGAVPGVVDCIDLAPQGRALVGTRSLNLYDGLVLGVRLVPDPSAGPGYLVMARYLGRDTRVPFNYSVSPAGTEGSANPEASPTDDAGESGDAVDTSDAGDTGGPGDTDDTGDMGETGESGDGSCSPPAGTGDGPRTPGVEPQAGAGGPDGSSGEAVPGRAEIVPTLEPPLINVIRVTKLTTGKREDRTYHAVWEWDFGDGERLTDTDPTHTLVTVEHTFAGPGTYTVRARSIANDGRVLRDLEWTVEATGGSGPGESAFTFEAETIVEPVVVLTVEGPKKWVTGKPARFKVVAEVSWPPRTRRQVIRAYPGWEFDVVWEKPGTFEVRGAVTVKQSYEFPDQRITVYNTYVTVVTVEVFTPGLTE